MKSFLPAVLALAAAACSHAVRETAVIPLARTISIPAFIDGGDASVLTYSNDGGDEPAEGPATFDLTSDGGFVISDPLRRRLVFYDAAGRFRNDMALPMAAEHVRVLPDNSRSVVRASTGQRYIFPVDGAGRYQPPRAATPADPDPDASDEGTAVLESAGAARVSAATAGSQPVAVRFEAPGEGMVSVRRIGSDTRGRTYVAIESAAPGSTVQVHKRIRKYAASGEIVAEIPDIPLDYYVHPDDEFRVRGGVVYQLLPRATGVRINIWDMSSKP